MRQVASEPHSIEDLYDLFGEVPPRTLVVPGSALPEPQRGLLAHESHMTVTLEAHHGGPVDVEVLERVAHGRHYARKILLRRNVAGSGGTAGAAPVVVQFGIMLFDLGFASEEAKLEILGEETPLGHILIRQRRLRRISTHSLLEIEPNAEIRRHFGLQTSGDEERNRVYGRLATIFCDEQPAVELLEVLPSGATAAAG